MIFTSFLVVRIFEKQDVSCLTIRKDAYFLGGGEIDGQANFPLGLMKRTAYQQGQVVAHMCSQR